MPRDLSRRQTQFGSWVSGFGVARLTRGLGGLGHPIKSSSVYDWLSGRTAPRPAHAAALVTLSRGEISLGDVYGHSTEVRSTSSGGQPRQATDSLAGYRAREISS